MTSTLGAFGNTGNTTNELLLAYLKFFKKQNLLNMYDLFATLNASSDISFEKESTKDPRVRELLEYLTVIKEEKQVYTLYFKFQSLLS